MIRFYIICAYINGQTIAHSTFRLDKVVIKCIRINNNCLASNLTIGMLRFVLPLYVIINFALSTAVSQ